MTLSFKYKGRVTKIWNYQPINNIKSDIQYALIISLFFNKATKRVEKEKTIRVKICLALSEDSENNDIDNGVDDAGEDSEGDGDVEGADDK